MRAPSLAAAIAILAVAGCGDSKAPAPHPHVPLTPFERHGKALFIPTCGPCHELADAGTSGTAGPAMTAPLRAALVLETIMHGKGAMTANLVTGRNAAAVAAYVAAATK